jgi:hypothetical protein
LRLLAGGWCLCPARRRGEVDPRRRRSSVEEEGGEETGQRARRERGLPARGGQKYLHLLPLPCDYRVADSTAHSSKKMRSVLARQIAWFVMTMHSRTR